MFTRLKKRLADEDGMRTSSPGSATRVPRTVSRESLASAGADSGEDSFSEGSASREELLVQLARRAEQVQRLEARLGEYGDQLRSVLRLKEKLELALEKQQDVAVTKAQELNELYQVNRARLAESASLALQEKDNEWRERVSILEKERREIMAKLREAEVLTAFARRDEHDEMSGLQIQEVAKVKHMLLQREEALQQAQSETESVRVEAQSERQMVGRLREELQELKKEMKEVQRTSESLKSENMLLLSTRADVDEARRRADTRNLELEDIVRKHRLEGQALQREVQQGGVARRVRDDHIIRLKERLANLGDIVNVDGEGRLENDGVDGTAERAKEELQQRELEGLMQKLWEAQELQDREILARQALSEELNDKNEALRQLHMEVQRQLECTESEARRRLEQEQRASRLEAQVAALETARTIERTTAHNSITQLERDLEERSEHLTEAKDALGALRGERDSFKTELARQGALNEEREKQVQALHADIENLSAQNQKMEASAEQSLLKVKELQEKASLAEEERDKLRTEVSALSISLAEVQNQLEATGTEDTAQSGDQMAGGENGEVDVICVEEPTLRAELKEKRKTIRQLQQRLAEMKRMLQRELKARSEPPCTQESRRVDASTEINLAYLKHVILKFISSRESEAFHLVKAVSVLLQFDADEERLLREMLEYKASWFGTRPLPSGITRPTISSPSLR